MGDAFDVTNQTTGIQEANIDASGNANFSGNVAVTGALKVTGATTLSGGQTLTGNETISGTLGVTGATTLSGGVAGNTISAGLVSAQGTPLATGMAAAGGYYVLPGSAQLSGWLASTMDPMAASGTTGSASVPASETFVAGLVYLPVAVSSTGATMFCVSLNSGTVSAFFAALIPATGSSATAVAVTAESHSSIVAATPVALAWSGGPIAVPAGYYYLGYVAKWASDAPTFVGSALADTYYPSASTANVVDNLNVHAENLVWGSGGFRWISQPSLITTTTWVTPTPADYVAATSLPFIGLY